MRIILLLFCLLLLGTNTATGQKKKKLSKKERKLEQYQIHKQSMIDTSFTFTTREITSPFLASNLTGGYLHIDGDELRVQEIDWIENSTNKKRLRDITKLENYNIQNGQESELTIVKFNGQIQGMMYYFTISYGLGTKPELSLQNNQKHTVRYTGKVKSN